jgi:hypothetical protein
VRQTLGRVQERQESIFNRARIESIATRLQRDALEVGPLIERARLALDTIGSALRVITIATRLLAKLL